MKSTLRSLFSPILNLFESGEGEYRYKPSYRLILKIVGLLFLTLALGALFAGQLTGQSGAIIPFAVFFALALVSEVVAFLGTDRAVAKIWGNR